MQIDVLSCGIRTNTCKQSKRIKLFVRKSIEKDFGKMLLGSSRKVANETYKALTYAFTN